MKINKSLFKKFNLNWHVWEMFTVPSAMWCNCFISIYYLSNLFAFAYILYV